MSVALATGPTEEEEKGHDSNVIFYSIRACCSSNIVKSYKFFAWLPSW